MHLFLKILSGMVNSVDPDQTAPSCLHVFAYAILSAVRVYKILGHLPYIFLGEIRENMKAFSWKKHLIWSYARHFMYNRINLFAWRGPLVLHQFWQKFVLLFHYFLISFLVHRIPLPVIENFLHIYRYRYRWSISRVDRKTVASQMVVFPNT